MKPTPDQVRESLATAEEYLRGVETPILLQEVRKGPFAHLFTEETIAFAREHVTWARRFLASTPTTPVR
jgi:hypothetical protein